MKLVKGEVYQMPANAKPLSNCAGCKLRFMKHLPNGMYEFHIQDKTTKRLCITIMSKKKHCRFYEYQLKNIKIEPMPELKKLIQFGELKVYPDKFVEI